MSQEVIEAAAKLKQHAWLERFRKANGVNGYNELSPTACNDIARSVDNLIDLIQQDASDGRDEEAQA